MHTLNVADVSHILGVSEESVRRWIRDNKLKAEKRLGRTGSSVELSDLVDFVNQPTNNYMAEMMLWLNGAGIPYEVVEENSGNIAGALAGATLGRLAVSGITALTGGPIGLAAGVAGTVIGGISGYRTGKNMKIILKKDEARIIEPDVSDGASSLLCTEAEAPPVSSDEHFVEPPVCAIRVLVDNNEEQKNFLQSRLSDFQVARYDAEIEDQKMKIEQLKVEQEKAQMELRRIQMEIELANHQIRYYEFLKNK